MNGISGINWMSASSSQYLTRTMQPDVSANLITSEAGDMMLDQSNSLFFPTDNSVSNQSIDDNLSSNAPNTDLEDFGSIMMDSNDTISIKEEYEDNNESNNTFLQSMTLNKSYLDYQNLRQDIPTTNLYQKKVKQIKQTGLELKSPIAFKSTSDPSKIPIQKDGMAVCEKCGAIGVKHAFYTREKRFCSLKCANNVYYKITKRSNESSPQYSSDNDTDLDGNYALYKFKIKQNEDTMMDFNNEEPVDDEFPQLYEPPNNMEETVITNIQRSTVELASTTYKWDLSDLNFFAAPVKFFKHAPLADIWDSIVIGMKVEVENNVSDMERYPDMFDDSFWVGTVLKIHGYKALVRYEGFGADSSKDFWVPICSDKLHQVGWCARRGKPLIPPKSIANKYYDWKTFLKKRLTGASTLPSNFYNKVYDSMKSRFCTNQNLEVVDKERIWRVKLGKIVAIVGKRLLITYYGHSMSSFGLEFWCHEDSPLIHPVGWALRVGHDIDAPNEYLQRIFKGIIHPDDATDELFLLHQRGSPTVSPDYGLRVGMKLEAIDPLNLSDICAATVMCVLKYGYIYIRIDTYDVDPAVQKDWFCYHVTSPCIFPVGFCKTNGIKLTPPKGFNPDTFDWSSLMIQNPNGFYRNSLLPLTKRRNLFQVGMKLEATDLMDPNLVCIATVIRVVGHLIRVSFDGWKEDYDQWLDFESPDIFPVGWCEIVGHNLQGPPQLTYPPKPSKKPKKPPRKKQTHKSQINKATHQNYRNKMNLAKQKLKSEQHNISNHFGNSQYENSFRLDATPTVAKHKFDEQTESEQPPMITLVPTSNLEFENNFAANIFQQQTNFIESNSYSDDTSNNQIEDKVKEFQNNFDETTNTEHSDAIYEIANESEDFTDKIEYSNENTYIEDNDLSSDNQLNSVSSDSVNQSIEDNSQSYLPDRTLEKSDQVISNETANVDNLIIKKYIPRLIDGPPTISCSSETICPDEWSVQDVAEFLKINGCNSYCDIFVDQEIDGKSLLLLTRDKIMKFTGMKVGPSLIIEDLIEKLKLKTLSPSSRFIKNNLKKRL